MEQPGAQALPQNHTLAIVSLVLGILGLVGILPILGSIAAIITGNMAVKEIRASPGQYTGEGMAKAGMILGWVGLGLLLLAICVLVAVLLFFVPFFREVRASLLILTLVSA